MMLSHARPGLGLIDGGLVAIASVGRYHQTTQHGVQRSYRHVVRE